uniref:DUF4629 domain-containing protein n=1 Tax=Castor canadensis TaxID=51338 RepID=A0A8C0XF77_CASCN
MGSENFHNPSLLGTENSLQLSIPAVSNAPSLTGSICNFSRVSGPAVTSAWLLPSASDTSFQTLMGNAYLSQHSSTTMLSEVTGENQISTSAASYPGVDWDITGSPEKKSSLLGDVTVTLINQDTAISSMTVTTQYDKTTNANAWIPLCPALSANFVQETPSQIPNQGHSLSLPYQEGSQVYYYNQNTSGLLLSGELGPCLQSYGNDSYTGSRASAPHPEMVMVLKEVQPTNVLTPVSTTGIYYSVAAQPITEMMTETSLGMENSLGLQPPHQTFCPPQTTECLNSCSSMNAQIPKSNQPLELGGISVIAPVQSSINMVALPPTLKQEQTEDENLYKIKTKLSKPPDAYQVTTENQDSPLLSLEIPDIHQLLACINPLGPEEKPCSENASLGKNSQSVGDKVTLDNGIQSSNGFADIITLVGDNHLLPIFKSFRDVDQIKSSIVKSPTDQNRKKKDEAFEHIDGAPQAKIQCQNPEFLLKGNMVVCSAAVSDRTPVNTAKHLTSKPLKAASSRASHPNGHGQQETKKIRKNNSKKSEESKQSANKVKAEKTTIPKVKRKKNQPEFSQETFKKPRTYLGMHMLESVQVFHALGKKSDKKIGSSSCWPLGNSHNIKGSQFSSAIKSRMDTPQEGKGPEKTQFKVQTQESNKNKDLCI